MVPVPEGEIPGEEKGRMQFQLDFVADDENRTRSFAGQQPYLTSAAFLRALNALLTARRAQPRADGRAARRDHGSVSCPGRKLQRVDNHASVSAAAEDVPHVLLAYCLIWLRHPPHCGRPAARYGAARAPCAARHAPRLSCSAVRCGCEVPGGFREHSRHLRVGTQRSVRARAARTSDCSCIIS
jgi:hypothetical protein